MKKNLSIIQYGIANSFLILSLFLTSQAIVESEVKIGEFEYSKAEIEKELEIPEEQRQEQEEMLEKKIEEENAQVEKNKLETKIEALEKKATLTDRGQELLTSYRSQLSLIEKDLKELALKKASRAELQTAANKLQQEIIVAEKQYASNLEKLQNDLKNENFANFERNLADALGELKTTEQKIDFVSQIADSAAAEFVNDFSSERFILQEASQVLDSEIGTEIDVEKSESYQEIDEKLRSRRALLQEYENLGAKNLQELAQKAPEKFYDAVQIEFVRAKELPYEKEQEFLNELKDIVSQNKKISDELTPLIDKINERLNQINSYLEEKEIKKPVTQIGKKLNLGTKIPLDKEAALKSETLTIHEEFVKAQENMESAEASGNKEKINAAEENLEKEKNEAKKELQQIRKEFENINQRETANVLKGQEILFEKEPELQEEFEQKDPWYRKLFDWFNTKGRSVADFFIDKVSSVEGKLNYNVEDIKPDPMSELLTKNSAEIIDGITYEKVRESAPEEPSYLEYKRLKAAELLKDISKASQEWGKWFQEFPEINAWAVDTMVYIENSPAFEGFKEVVRLVPSEKAQNLLQNIENNLSFAVETSGSPFARFLSSVGATSGKVMESVGTFGEWIAEKMGSEDIKLSVGDIKIIDAEIEKMKNELMRDPEKLSPEQEESTYKVIKKGLETIIDRIKGRAETVGTKLDAYDSARVEYLRFLGVPEGSVNKTLIAKALREKLQDPNLDKEQLKQLTTNLITSTNELIAQLDTYADSIKNAALNFEVIINGWDSIQFNDKASLRELMNGMLKAISEKGNYLTQFEKSIQEFNEEVPKNPNTIEKFSNNFLDKISILTTRKRVRDVVQAKRSLDKVNSALKARKREIEDKMLQMPKKPTIGDTGIDTGI